MKKASLTIVALTTLLFFFSCGKSNAPADMGWMLHNTWIYTASYGNITVNNFPLAASEARNTNPDNLVTFGQDGNYIYKYPVSATETDGYVLSDSSIVLHSDSSYFANFCAYPVVYFGTSPGIPEWKPTQVQGTLTIVNITQDSLKLISRLVKPGNNASDTIYTELTVFRKK